MLLLTSLSTECLQAALATASILPTVWLAVLLATFCSHVACHLPHHPLFLVKVLWPVAATMVITDITHLLPAQHLLVSLIAAAARAPGSKCSACRPSCPDVQ